MVCRLRGGWVGFGGKVAVSGVGRCSVGKGWGGGEEACCCGGTGQLMKPWGRSGRRGEGEKLPRQAGLPVRRISLVEGDSDPAILG